MLVAGIDVGAELHHVAVVDRAEAVVVKATAFAENAAGYQDLFALLARAGARGGEDLARAAAALEYPGACREHSEQNRSFLGGETGFDNQPAQLDLAARVGFSFGDSHASATHLDPHQCRSSAAQ